MKYTSDIYELPLSVFIEIYTNENNNIAFEEEKEVACRKLVTEYMEIVGGKMLTTEIAESNAAVNLEMMMRCIEACEVLMQLNMYGKVCDVLLSLGYSCKKEDVGGIKARISALKARVQYDIAKMKGKKQEKKNEKPTKRGFVNEIVAIGKFNKIHINTKEWTAGAYACLVKQTCDEIEEMNRMKR